VSAALLPSSPLDGYKSKTRAEVSAALLPSSPLDGYKSKTTAKHGGFFHRVFGFS
jgi:hypothetical protein